jgi:hypothetical protein
MHSYLQNLLKQRLAVIADHSFRDRDAAAHLEALKSVSEEIQAYTAEHLSELDGKLRHFLSNASYQKALDHLSEL